MSSRRKVALLLSLGAVAALAAARHAPVARAGGPTEPDVVVLELIGVAAHGSAGGFRAYSLGTTACNVGTAPLNWCNEPGGCGAGTTSHDHPVIAQNLYRLKGGRFEQIGMSWLKHGFASTNSSDGTCGTCVGPPLGGDQLGVGCTDTYSAGLNGARPLGMRSEVNATTGLFPYPFTAVAPQGAVEQRIRVAQADLDPAQNPGARYWMEAIYVTPDDAAAGNALNNASYREAAVGVPPAPELSLTGTTVIGAPALLAWQAADPEVEITAVDAPASSPIERFFVGRRVTDLGGGSWHYEYAVENLNSDRGARGFAVRFGEPTTIGGAGFHGIAHHSGEPYATGDWRVNTLIEDVVAWHASPFAADPDANALRWGTTFSFWFDASSPPGPEDLHLLLLFKPGGEAAVFFDFGSP